LISTRGKLRFSNLPILSVFRAGELVESDIDKINDILAKPTGKKKLFPC
jgi:hypothetical protein